MKSILVILISFALSVGLFAQTRNVVVGTNDVIVSPTNFWNANATNARAGLGLGSAATNPASAFQPSSTILSNLASSNGSELTNISVSNVVGALATNGNGAGLTNLTAANITGTVALASNVTGTIAISNGGSGATTAGGARTNLGLGVANDVTFNSVTAEVLYYGTNGIIGLVNQELYDGGIAVLGWSTNSIEINAPILLGTSNAISATRTNLGLGWPALTNTTASGFQTDLFGTGTNPVLVNTNGEVVSPTNFWQVAPITTTFIESQPVTNFTTNITPARFLHIHSLATNIANVTNTIVLPTNTLTFEGDVAIVVHKGPTNSMTRVQRAGSTNNLITLTRFDEAVQFVYYNDVWQFDHNIAFVEPIYFSGTNAASNAAASRTNLGLGTTNNVQFKQVSASDGETTVLNSSGIESTDWAARVSLEERLLEEGGLPAFVWSTNGNTTLYPFVFINNSAATTRTNLGLPLAALTNSNTTNFQAAVFQTNTAPVSAAQFGDRAAWMEVNVITNGSNVSFRIPLYK